MKYHRYYDVEEYLFDTVTWRFAEQGCLNAFDFFSIVRWKANRAISKVAARLLSKGHTDLHVAVNDLTSSIHRATGQREKLRVLIEDWGFRLPMASGILSVLYPEEFTVYDVRVCRVLGKYGSLTNRTKFESIWNGYEQYLDAVKEAAPSQLSLRDKDRWLWGRSAYEDLLAFIESPLA